MAKDRLGWGAATSQAKALAHDRTRDLLYSILVGAARVLYSLHQLIISHRKSDDDDDDDDIEVARWSSFRISHLLTVATIPQDSLSRMRENLSLFVKLSSQLGSQQ